MKQRLKKVIAAAFLGSLMGASGSVSAAEVGLSSLKFTRLLTDTSRFGFCFAGVNAAGQAELASKAPGCSGNFISFGCAADPQFGLTRSQAERNYQAAQLAFVADKTVTVVVETAQNYNGICLAKRLDVR